MRAVTALLAAALSAAAVLTGTALVVALNPSPRLEQPHRPPGATATSTTSPRQPPAPTTTSSCQPTTTRYPDQSVWHGCAPDDPPTDPTDEATPGPAVLPTEDPFATP